MSQWSEDFENAMTLNQPWSDEGESDISTDRSTDFALDGSYSFKFDLPAQLYANARGEITPIVSSPYIWEGVSVYAVGLYSTKFAIYIPSDYNFDSTSWSMLMQMKGDPTAGRVDQPTMSVHENYSGQITICSRYNDVVPPDNNSTNVIHTHPVTSSQILGQLTKGSWHYFHVEGYWDYATGGDGYLRVYLSKTGWPTINDIIVDYTGPLGYNDPRGSYFKIGIYKWPWLVQANVDASIADGCTGLTRYYDAVTVADEILPLTGNQGVGTLLI